MYISRAHRGWSASAASTGAFSDCQQRFVGRASDPGRRKHQRWVPACSCVFVLQRLVYVCMCVYVCVYLSVWCVCMCRCVVCVCGVCAVLSRCLDAGLTECSPR